MEEHIWGIEEVDGGLLGICDFYICHQCGASGGPVWPGKSPPTFAPFLADGSGYDCAEAKRQIESHNKKREKSS